MVKLKEVPLVYSYIITTDIAVPSSPSANMLFVCFEEDLGNSPSLNGWEIWLVPHVALSVLSLTIKNQNEPAEMWYPLKIYACNDDLISTQQFFLALLLSCIRPSNCAV